MSDVANAEEVKRSKRQAGDADSDSYEEYKSDEEGRGAGEEEDTLKNEEEKVKIISVVQTDDKVVDGDKKKDKKKKEKRSKHDKEGAENGDGQDRKERKKEKKSKEGKKEKKPKEHRDKEKTDDVKTEKVEEVKKVVTFEEVPQKEEPTTVVKVIEEVSQKEEPTTVEKHHEKAEESKPAAPEAPQENPPSVVAVPVKVVDEAAPVAPTEAAPPKQKEEEKAEHPVGATEAPLPATKEEKTEAPVVLAEAAPPSEPPASEKKEDVAHPEAAPSAAAATISTLSETATVSANESQPIAVSQPPVAESHPPQPSPPSTDAVVTETGDHLPPKSDASGQENVSTPDKREEPQAAPLTGVQKILEHARKEAEVRATGSSKMLMARNLVSRQEKLQEQLTNMRHEFGDIDSEIRALKIDCYRNQRAYPKHQ